MLPLLVPIILSVLNLYACDKNQRLQNHFATVPNVKQRNLGYVRGQPYSSSRYFISPPYSYKPSVANRRVDRQILKPVDFKNRQSPLVHQLAHQYFPKKPLKETADGIRQVRKISNTFNLRKDIVKNKLTKKPILENVKKDKLKLIEKDDNIAIESAVVETRVEPPKNFVAPKLSYSSGSKATPVPKFIIKQAGPSQTFDWLGHGRYAPLNIPNIFRNVGLNTYWNPEVNSIFPVGLNYPPPPSKNSSPQSKPQQPAQSIKHEVKKSPVKTIPVTKIPAPIIKEEPIPVYIPSQSIYNESPTSKPAYPHKTSELETLYYDYGKHDSHTTTQKPSNKVTVTTNKPKQTQPPVQYKPKLTQPPVQYKPKPTLPQVQYKPTTTKQPVQYKPSTTKAPTKYTYATQKPSTKPALPSYYQTTKAPFQYNYASPKYVSSTTYRPAPQTYFSSPTYNIQGISTISPYYGSPSTSVPYFGSPTPTPFYASPQKSTPAPYKQSVFSKPIKPFTAFGNTVSSANNKNSEVSEAVSSKQDSKTSAPVIGIIETEANTENPAEDDGEVFYIFYENEDLPQKSKPSGLDLQRFIQDGNDANKFDDNDYSESIANEKVKVTKEEQKFPNFALIEEVGKPELPLYYDVPIKIEETIEPIDEVRTIYVPIENAINVPESVSLGSFGFNKINSPAAAALKLTGDDPSLFGNFDHKVVRKVRKLKHGSPVSSPVKQHQPGLGSSYYGSRLEPRQHYDIVL